MLRMLLPIGLFTQFLSSAFSASNSTQVVILEAAWNLLSYQIDTQLDVKAFKGKLNHAENLIAVWNYTESQQLEDPGSWLTGQPQLPDFPSDAVTLQPGRAYWVRVSQQTILTLNGPAWDGPQQFFPGWNLIGFSGLQTDTHEQQELESVFGDNFAKVQQVWTFNASAQSYSGYDLTAIPQLQDLSTIHPGQGYWVYATEGFILSSTPYLALEGDLDASPLQPEEQFQAGDSRFRGPDDSPYIGQRVRYRASEDIPYDLNNNGILDSPFTQDTIRFDAGVETKVISIGNNGQNAINWKLETTAPWLTFDVSEGVVSSESDSNRTRGSDVEFKYCQYFPTLLGWFTCQENDVWNTLEPCTM